MTKSEQIEVLKSAGYSESTAKQALNIGVWFFNNLDELKEFDASAIYDKGALNGKDIFFIDTSIIC